MKTYGGLKVYLHSFITSALGGGLATLLLGEDPPILTRQEAGWAPDTVWTWRQREKYPFPASARN
jgi:hypothetical protein